jgi:excinuclease ABC subunit A
VIFQGSPAELIGNGHGSLTGAYLGGQIAIETPKDAPQGFEGRDRHQGRARQQPEGLRREDPARPPGRRDRRQRIGQEHARQRHPLQVAGAEFYRAADEPGAHDTIEGINLIDKVIEIDQSPIGRTPRSNPATYTSLFTFIRELFAMVPEARTRGFKPGRFSFNVKGGRCEACQGDGVIAIEMHFLPNVYVTCEQCKGRRYNRETLEIKYRGKSIADVLDLTVDQALPLLENFPPIATKLRTLQSVGLGYITLGQSATTLSGGEAQRVKLSRELSKRGTGRTLYILDEPTTGLHFEDVRKLLDVLMRLVEQGNTIVVIEHNLDVIKSADWLIDLGPEGGEGGGSVVAGTPEQVAKAKGSATGHFLPRSESERASTLVPNARWFLTQFGPLPLWLAKHSRGEGL